MKRSRQVVEWLSDWRDRAEVEPYMLNNLFFSLQDTGDREEAARVLARGLEFPRHDDTTMRFHLYAALENLLSSKEAAALKHLEVVHRPDLSAFSVRVLELVKALVHYQPGKPAKPFDEGVSQAIEAFLDSNKTRRLGLDYVSRACRHVARHNRSWKPLVWLFFKRHGTLFSILFAVALIALGRAAS